MIYQINKKQNIFNDDIAYVEQWDFSKANLNEENRILAINFKLLQSLLSKSQKLSEVKVYIID